MPVDPETVVLMSTYRVGFAPPKKGSLAAGELYIQVATPDQGPPWIWIGQMDDNSPALLVPAPDSVAPINLDVPYVSQEAEILHCTTGNWFGEPDTYSFQWLLDGVNVGTDAEDYTVLPADAGKIATCVVSAINATGTTAAPPSNGVVVVA
jgi:hypothetical protein